MCTPFQTGSGMISARAGRYRPGGAEKRFLINGECEDSMKKQQVWRWVQMVMLLLAASGINNRVDAAVTNAGPPVGMVLIAAGTNSGTDPDHGAYALTNAAGFYMDATEVTKAKWDEVYSRATSIGYLFDNAGSARGTNHPVQSVNWYDCVKWCNARSELEGRTPCYTAGGAVCKTNSSDPGDGSGGVICNFTANGYRLPTNMEWEYAARGGASGHRFPWNDSEEIQYHRANYRSLGKVKYDTGETRGYHREDSAVGVPFTTPVGSFAANGYGLYDMAGNVQEWCWDAIGPTRSLRGGNWSNNASYARCGYLYWCSPFYGGTGDGFRTVCR
jgi:sulfatase modifying factor 1